jgi:hypothetical protein
VSCPFPPMREPNSNPMFSPAAPTDSSLRILLPLRFVQNPHAVRIAGYAVHGALAATILLFLLPGAKFPPRRTSYSGEAFRRRFADGLFRGCNTNLFAANQIFDSIPAMVESNNSGSKLCAVRPRHATRRRPSGGAVAQLGKGRGFALPVASPPVRRERRVETLPVSIPSGLRFASAFRSRGVCP